MKQVRLFFFGVATTRLSGMCDYAALNLECDTLESWVAYRAYFALDV